jgi:hypothetical protein
MVLPLGQNEVGYQVAFVEWKPREKKGQGVQRGGYHEFAELTGAVLSDIPQLNRL